MNVNVLLFARLRREAGIETTSVELPTQSTVRDLAARVETDHRVSLSGCMVAVNEQYAMPDTILREGDEVAFLPPVAGGSDEDVRCEVSELPIDLRAAQAFLVRPEWGAQAYFVGTVRSPNQGVEIAYLEYEAFPPMAVQVMRQAVRLAREQFALGGAYLVHRTGRLVPGEASILVGVGSAHRRAALEACDFLIEYLKVHIPVWKLEVGEHGERWVEGSTGAPTL